MWLKCNQIEQYSYNVWGWKKDKISSHNRMKCLSPFATKKCNKN